MAIQVAFKTQYAAVFQNRFEAKKPFRSSWFDDAAKFEAYVEKNLPDCLYQVERITRQHPTEATQDAIHREWKRECVTFGENGTTATCTLAEYEKKYIA